MTHEIPTPPGLPILGHALLFKSEFPMETQYLLTKQYGGIFRLLVPGRSLITIGSHELMHEISDDKRFRKRISGTLTHLRYAVGDGLLTATVPGEENWNIAHRVLAPTFSAISLRNFFDDMMDVVSQLVLKWERFGAHHTIDTGEDFTALSFEIICLTCMSYRINSFYSDGAHPFAFAVADYNEQAFVLGTSGLIKALRFGAKAKLEANKATLSQFVDEMLEDRKARPPPKEDMLHEMLHKEDPVTGRKMTELSVKQNLLTLLMAGHETTSSLLTFALYYLIQNPVAMRKLREEIDTILDGRLMTADDMSKLPYLIAVLRETLRLSPSAPARIVEATEDTTLAGGKYAIKKGDELIVCTYIAQRDPAVWGDDADEFRPERMLDGKFEALPPDAWQPFGVGIRACLGRAFAWQEAQLVLACLVQHFTFAFADAQPARLRVRQTITLRPAEVLVRAVPRTDRRGPVSLAARGAAGGVPARGAANGAEKGRGAAETDEGGGTEGGVPMYVYFGSDMGTSEQFARRIAADAGRRGFKASVAQLNAATASVPTDGPVVIVTASYEGKPPENAAHFVEWLGALKDEGACAGVAYAVFGCGNRDWVQTYQRVPTRVDAGLAAAGASRIAPRGEGDASAGDFFERFARWEDALWAALAERYDTKTEGAGEPQVDVELAAPGAARAKALAQEDAATTGTVVENRVLTAPGAPVKRHIKFQLPEGSTFIAGDYLAVLPTNPPRDVRRALARFGLLPDQEITIKAAGFTSLPTGHPIAVSTLLSGYVELAQPATTRDLQSLSAAAKSDAEKLVFKELADNHTELVVAERLSVLDILEAHPDIAIPFPAFLQLLPAMRVRQYSISSSPLADPTRAALTIRVFEAERTAGRAEPLLGVASSFLGALHAGDRVQLAVRPCKREFRLSADPATPLVMICAGAGLAPMRGFLQERALQKQAGRDVATSVLFFGCRDPGEDYLYKDSDLKEWVALGVVDVRPAFSRASGESLDCKYVQDRLWHDRADVVAAWDAGAKLYLCGSAKMAAGVREKLVLIVQDALQLDRAAAVQHFSTKMADRFATDVFE